MTVGYVVGYANIDLGAGYAVCTKNAVSVEASDMTNYLSAVIMY